MKIRYIRDWSNGSNMSDDNNWKEIKALTADGRNVAFGKKATNPFTSYNSHNLTYITDNSITNTYVVPKSENNGEAMCVEIDLEEQIEVKSINTIRWVSSASDTIYNNTKLEVSENKIEWHVIFDSATEGTYTEHQTGKIFLLEDQKNEDLPTNATLDDVFNRLEEVNKNLIYKGTGRTILIGNKDYVLGKGNYSGDILIKSPMNNSKARRWAEGLAYPTYSRSFTNLVGEMEPFRYVFIGGLGFTPKIVLCFSSNTSKEIVSILSPTGMTTLGGESKVCVTVFQRNRGSLNTTVTSIQVDGNVILDGNYSIPVAGQADFKWIAYE